MNNKFKYQRSFLIFNEEDNGYGADQKPSGHLKIEIRDGKGKLSCNVSNLSDDNGKIEYRLYLIKTDGYQCVPVLLGNIELKRNRGDFNWSFNPRDIKKTGIEVDRFNVFVVVGNYLDRKSNYIICPLAAYKGDKVEWRQGLNKILQQEKKDEKMLNQKKKDDDINNKLDDDKFENDNKNNKPTIDNKHFEKEQIKNADGEPLNGGKHLTDNQKIEIEKQNQGQVEKQFDQDSEKYFETIEKKDMSVEFDSTNKEIEEENDKKEVEEQAKLPKTKANQTKTVKGKMDDQQIKGKSYSSYDGSKLFDLQTDDDIDNKNFNAGTINNIFFNNKNSDKSEIKEFEVQELSKQFDLIFERCVPFSVERTDYNWWKVASPVHLNNILYTFGIKIPVLFNPLVLMAHYKYNHLIVGIYKDDIRQKDYIVCGIPGIYWVDEKPFGNACRWAQVEGNTPAYGAFGYWVVYINPKTGRILSLDK